jgi:NAD(P)-dependent dehydrogenase (short-subunit alcohol dehydrogenase family)
MTARTWLITGVSSGLGLELAKAALAVGDTVAGTVRKEADRAAFDALAPGRAIGLIMDLADEAAVRAAVADAESRLGRIDILVNNAGYGLIGAVEEASLAEAKAQFDVNLFGVMAVIQAVLPAMRARRAGRILTVTSVSGLAAWGGTGVYCASKFALEGLTQALAQEVAGLGIKVTNIAPGGLRTDYAGRSLVLTERTLDDYEGSSGFARRVLQDGAGRESGDPAKAAAAILKIAEAENPPMHLLLGQDAIHYATRSAAQLQTDLGEWIGLTASIGADP